MSGLGVDGNNQIKTNPFKVANPFQMAWGWTEVHKIGVWAGHQWDCWTAFSFTERAGTGALLAEPRDVVFAVPQGAECISDPAGSPSPGWDSSGLPGDCWSSWYQSMRWQSSWFPFVYPGSPSPRKFIPWTLHRGSKFAACALQPNLLQAPRGNSAQLPVQWLLLLLLHLVPLGLATVPFRGKMRTARPTSHLSDMHQMIFVNSDFSWEN